jgi:small-conductance mechanosensitive channel
MGGRQFRDQRYDTDLEKARKLIKKIEQEMAVDPEFAPDIIEPLKMGSLQNLPEILRSYDRHSGTSA